VLQAVNSIHDLLHARYHKLLVILIKLLVILVQQYHGLSHRRFYVHQGLRIL